MAAVTICFSPKKKKKKLVPKVVSYAKQKNKKTKKHYKCGTSFGIGRQHKLKGSEERVYRGWKCGEKLVIGGLRKGDPW